MILQNNTRIQDNTIRAVIEAARIEADTGGVNVFVQVNRSGLKCSGAAHYVRSVMWGRNPHQVRCRNAIRLSLTHRTHPLWSSETFYEVAAHEWAHIKEYEEKGYIADVPGTHKHNRPSEVTADLAAELAVANIDRHRPAITALALELARLMFKDNTGEQA